MNPPPIVRHNTVGHRYENETDGRLSFAEYEIVEDKQVFTHTFVPEELRGRGLAEALVKTALDDALRAKRKIVPSCWYVAKYIDRHQEYQPLLVSS